MSQAMVSMQALLLHARRKNFASTRHNAAPLPPGVLHDLPGGRKECVTSTLFSAAMARLCFSLALPQSFSSQVPFHQKLIMFKHSIYTAAT